MTDTEILELLYNAKRSEIGTCVETTDPERFRQRAYTVRKGDPDLANLSFIISPFNSKDVWILNKPETPSER